MNNKEYQFKICKFLVKRKLEDEDERKKITNFKLKDLPLFDRKKSIKENMDKLKQSLNQIIKANPKEPIIEIRNKEALNKLVKNYNDNKKIKIKYKRIKLDYFLGKICSKAYPDKLFLRKFIEDKKIEIYYNGKNIRYGIRGVLGMMCRFMFNDRVANPDEDKGYNINDHNWEKCDPINYISFRSIAITYEPGITEVNLSHLVCLMYYHADREKLNLQSEELLSDDNLQVNININKINQKARTSLGIDLIKVGTLGQSDNDGVIKLSKIGQIKKMIMI